MEENYDEYLANLTDDDGEVRELTSEDFSRFQPLSAFPDLQRRLLSLKRPGPASTVEDKATVALSRDVVAPFRTQGEGWEGRMENALRDWLREHAA